MPQKLVYHWKHGWIPLTHAAALSKAHGSASLADKYVPGTSSHHADRPTVGHSARSIHGGLESHDVSRLQHGDHATVTGMDQYGQPMTFTGHVSGVPTPVQIKHGRNGTPEPHLAIGMHNGSAGSGGLDATARTTVYVKAQTSISDQHAATVAASTPDALAAKRAEHAARTPREIMDALKAHPSSVSDQDLQRVGRLGGRFGPVANAELARRDEAAMKAQGRDPVAERAALANAIAGPNSWRRTPAEAAHPHGLKPGDGVILTNVGSSGERSGTYQGLDVNGNPTVASAVNGQLVRESVRPDQIRPKETPVSPFDKARQRATRDQYGVLNRDSGPVSVTAAGLPPRYTIHRDQYGFALKKDNKLLRSSSERDRLVSYAHDHAAGDTSGHTPTVADRMRAERAAAVAAKAADPPPSDARRFGAAANAGQKANVQEAQAAERAARLKAVKPVQGEMFGASGEHQPDLFAQPPAAPSGASARVNVAHSGDGTLLNIDRTDTEARQAAKDAGFRWSSNLGAWYLPRGWSDATRRERISRLQKDLGAHNVHVKDAGSGVTTTAAEREAAARAHAAGRAERMDAKAQRLATEADVRFGRAKAIGDMIPMGQPILVGHHSEKRHRKDLAKIDSNMRAGFEADQAAKDAANSAENARRTAAGDSPLARQRRIDRNAAEVRKIDRTLQDHNLAVKAPAITARMGMRPLEAEHLARLQAEHARLSDQIAHDRSQIEASGHRTLTSAEIGPGDVVHYRGRPHVVKKVNKTTVSVPTGYSWDDKVPINQISKHTKLSTLSTSSIEAALGSERDPKVRSHFVAELRKRGVRINGS